MKNREWKAFVITDIFNVIYMGKSSDSGNLNSGSTPFIGRSSGNNGYENNYNIPIEKINKVPAITVSLIGRSTAFYQEFEFATSQNILILRNSKLNKYNGLFLVTCLNNYLKPFLGSYGLPGSLKRMNRAKILLPSKNGLPDWSFMEEYILVKKNKLKTAYKSPNKNEVIDKRGLNEVEWKEFFVENIINIKNGVRLTKEDQKDGSVPFIGASDNNNGITEFISNENKSTDKNVLGTNYNGSVGCAFYHPYKATFSDDVKRLSFSNGNNSKYTLLFLKHVIERQARKYAYGYKFNGQRMKRQIIKLPAKDNQPDFVFMEQYMKRMENNVLEKAKKMFE